MFRSGRNLELDILENSYTVACFLYIAQRLLCFLQTSVPALAAELLPNYRAGLGPGSSGVRVPAGAGNSSLPHNAHPASYPMGIRGSVPEGKAAGA
jgi:hypothetical protein